MMVPNIKVFGIEVDKCKIFVNVQRMTFTSDLSSVNY